jgi:hypothetical protein
LSEVRLSWVAPAAGPVPDGYNLYWGRLSGVYNAIGSPKNMGNVLSGGVDIDQTATWFFAVKAFNSAGESPFSTEINRAIALGVVTGRAN